MIVHTRNIRPQTKDFFLCEFIVVAINFEYALVDVDGKIIVRFYIDSEIFDYDTNLLWTTFDDDDNILFMTKMTKKSYINLTLLITKKYL